MLHLAIEASNPSAACGAGVALARIEARRIDVLGSESLRRAERHSDDLMTAIQRLAIRTGVRPGDIQRVCVSAGPGGYTGLRMAIVCAQAIADAAGAMCVGVPTELVVARRVESGGRAFGVCLASKGASTFARPFGADGAPRGPGRVIGSESLLELEVQLLIADRFLPDQLRLVAAGAGIEIRPPVFDPAAVLEAAGNLDPVEPVALRAIYPREPDAVTQWRRLHGGGGPGG